MTKDQTTGWCQRWERPCTLDCPGNGFNGCQRMPPDASVPVPETTAIRHLLFLAYVSLTMIVVGVCCGVAGIIVDNEKLAIGGGALFGVGAVMLWRVREITDG